MEYEPSLHLAVAPAGSLLDAATLGALDSAGAEVVGAGDACAAEPAGEAAEPAGAGVAAGAADVGCVAVLDGAAGVAGAPETVLDVAPEFDASEVAAGLDLSAFCIPPCPLQAPRPEDVDALPSLHMVVAGVLDAPAAGLAPPDMAPLAGGVEAGALGAAAVEPDVAAFCFPPCPLHAPRPVAVEVVPSLHIMDAAVSSAKLGNVIDNMRSGGARAPRILVIFMKLTPWLILDRSVDSRPQPKL